MDQSQAIIIIVIAASLEEDVPLNFITVGRDASQELARNDPATAILNTSSYPEFAATVANLTIVRDPGEGEE